MKKLIILLTFILNSILSLAQPALLHGVSFEESSLY